MRAGVTGHQDLGTVNTIRWVSEVLSEVIEEYEVTKGFTSLAIGADQLYADLLFSKGVPYITVIPCDGYESTFEDDERRDQYELMLSRSEEVTQLDFDEPSEKAFFEAGKCIVESSDLLFAVWNGKESRGLGGTGDVVEYAVRQKKKVVHLNPITKELTEK
jgi:hypothetical protein